MESRERGQKVLAPFSWWKRQWNVQCESVLYKFLFTLGSFSYASSFRWWRPPLNLSKYLQIMGFSRATSPKLFSTVLNIWQDLDSSKSLISTKVSSRGLGSTMKCVKIQGKNKCRRLKAYQIRVKNFAYMGVIRGGLGLDLLWRNFGGFCLFLFLN